MTECTFCRKEIIEQSDQYGPVQAPVCWNCWINEEVLCPNMECDNGRIPCDTCGGGGWIITVIGVDSCMSCSGDGYHLCDTCDGKGTIIAESMYHIGEVAHEGLGKLFPNIAKVTAQ